MAEIHNAIHVVGSAVLWFIAFAIAIYVVGHLGSFVLWRQSSDEAKQMGAMMQKENGYDAGASAGLFDMLLENVDDAMDDLRVDSHLEYEPAPVAQLDYSLDNPHSTDLNHMMSALADAGFYVHPFPREREGEWSTRNAGIWKQEPTWYLEDDENRMEVTPDTHEWQVVEATT